MSTLTCIALYGRQSWYQICLSLPSLALSTTTLIYASVIWISYMESHDDEFDEPFNQQLFCSPNPVNYSQWCGSGLLAFDVDFQLDFKRAV